MIRFEWVVGHEATDSAFDSLWTTLYHLDPAATFFASPSFARFVEATFAPPRVAAGLIAWVGDQPALCWPLGISRTAGWPPIRELGHRNWWHTPYGDPVTHPEAIRDARAILAHLHGRPGIDRLNLWRLADPVWGEAAPSIGLRAEPMRDRALVFDRPHALRSKHRRELDRLRRRLGEAGTLSVTWFEDESIAEIGRPFADLHTRLKRWQRQWPVFQTHPDAGARLGPALAPLARDGHAVAVRLAVDDVPRGILIAFIDKGSVLTWRSAWDPDWAPYGLGGQLLEAMRGFALERGHRELRLLPGDEPYKTDWTNVEGTVSHLVGARRTWRTVMHGAMTRLGGRRSGSESRSASD